MSDKVRDVYVYISELPEGYSTQNYVKLAVGEYLKLPNETLLDKKNVSEETFLLKRTPAGKPYFPNCKDIGFSVSHGGKYVVCALAQGDIGVDIEPIKKFEDESDEMFSARLCKIADRFFHQTEAEYIKIDPTTRFYEVFTAKESYVKLKGTGFDETLGEISVLPRNVPMPSCHEKKGSVAWISDDASFWQALIGCDYTLCVCTSKESCPKIFWI